MTLQYSFCYLSSILFITFWCSVTGLVTVTLLLLAPTLKARAKSNLNLIF